MTNQQLSRIALVIDYDNAQLAAKECELKHCRASHLWMRPLIVEVERVCGGRVEIRRAYGNTLLNAGRIFHEREFSPRTIREQISLDLDVQSDMFNNGFQVIHCPSAAGKKNRADILMSLDCMEIAATYAHIDTFAILSHDSDFSPLIQRLRALGKSVALVTVGRAQEKSLRALAALATYRVVFDQEVVDRVGYEQLNEVLKELQEDPSAPLSSGVSLTALYSRMRERDPTFLFESLGFQKLSDFVDACLEEPLYRSEGDVKVRAAAASRPAKGDEAAAQAGRPATTLEPGGPRGEGAVIPLPLKNGNATPAGDSIGPGMARGGGAAGHMGGAVPNGAGTASNGAGTSAAVNDAADATCVATASVSVGGSNGAAAGGHAMTQPTPSIVGDAASGGIDAVLGACAASGADGRRLPSPAGTTQPPVQDRGSILAAALNKQGIRPLPELRKKIGEWLREHVFDDDGTLRSVGMTFGVLQEQVVEHFAGSGLASKSQSRDALRVLRLSQSMILEASEDIPLTDLKLIEMKPLEVSRQQIVSFLIKRLEGAGVVLTPGDIPIMAELAFGTVDGATLEAVTQGIELAKAAEAQG